MKTNIAILTPSLICGGAERAVSLLANNLQKSGKYQVFLYVLIDCEPFYHLDPSIKIFYIDNKITSNKKPQLVNVSRAKYVKRLNESNFVSLIIGYSAQSALVSCLACFNTKVKCLICELSYPKRYGIIFKIKRQFLYRRADGAVHQTNYVNNYFKNLINNGTVIYNLIEIDELSDYVLYSQRPNKIVSVGRLDEGKNFAMLIKAFFLICDKHPDYIVEIYGEGRLKNELSQLIQSLNMQDKIFLKGQKSNIFEYIKNAKLFVLTSNMEGFPNALLEAILLGVPCISTDCPAYAPRDMLEEAYCGTLVGLDNHEELAEKMNSFLGLDIDDERLRENMFYLRNKYNLSNTISKWIDYIEKIIN